MQPALYDLSPLWGLLLVGAALAAGPLLWVRWRHRGAPLHVWARALALTTVFLTFDLVLFGAFTRLTDSGLGCPDWPGCYASASPIGARAHIERAQTELPSGPVTHSKAWVEMVHRYLATGVGALIAFLCGLAWWSRLRSRGAPCLPTGVPTLTLVWVCVQGAFGALTVTMKLFPAIVTLHLLGGYVLLALLVVQVHGYAPVKTSTPISPWLYRGLWAGLAMLMLQAASGAWVSTNYAVLVCGDFPQCQGQWWPPMDFAQGFVLWRPLGLGTDGASIAFEALTAIHYTHRMLALVAVLVLACVAWQVARVPALRRAAMWLLGLLVLQVLTGLSNVVLGWPLLGAVLHTGGAGALVIVLVWLLMVSGVAAAPRARGA